MLFLHVLLFSIVGTSVSALEIGQNVQHAAAVEPTDELDVPTVTDDRTLDGFWSRHRLIPGFNRVTIIRVYDGRVYHWAEEMVGEGEIPDGRLALKTEEYKTITGPPWRKSKPLEGRMVVSGPCNLTIPRASHMYCFSQLVEPPQQAQFTTLNDNKLVMNRSQGNMRRRRR